MTTPLNGTISLSDYNVVWGNASNATISLADASSRTIGGKPVIGSQISLSDGYAIDVYAVGVGVNPAGYLGYSQGQGGGEIYGSLSPLFYYGFQFTWVASDAAASGNTSYLVLASGVWGVNIPAPSRISSPIASGGWISQFGGEARYNAALFLPNQSGQTIKVAMRRAF